MPTKTPAKSKPTQRAGTAARPSSRSIPATAPSKAKLPKAAPSKAKLPKAAPSKAKLPAAAPSKAKLPKAAPSKANLPKAAPSKAKLPKASAAPAKRESARPTPLKRDPKLGPPRPAPDAPKPLSLEERMVRLNARIAKVDPHWLQRHNDEFDMTWIHHDSALEGVVYTPQELRAAIDPQAALEVDSSLQPICEEIRRHREALTFIRDYASKPKQPLTVDTVKQIYLILHPEEGDLKTVKYRKDIPQHRLYFHEYAAPDKIGFKVRQVIDWIHDPETKKSRNAMRIATRAHYDLLRVFPFQTDSGKVARLFMNLMLLRAGLPPAIVAKTERQRYYDALKGASALMNQIVADSIEENLASVERRLDHYEATQGAPR